MKKLIDKIIRKLDNAIATGDDIWEATAELHDALAAAKKILLTLGNANFEHCKNSPNAGEHGEHCARCSQEYLCFPRDHPIHKRRKD